MAQSAPIIALIAAVAENGVIGRAGSLPWHLPSEMKFFRDITMGKPVIMGRKTFISLPRPLKGRDNIVITRDDQFAAPGAIVANSFGRALAIAQECATRRNVNEIMVIGGAEIYREALPETGRIYLTRVHASPAGDTIFPVSDFSSWSMRNVENYAPTEKDDFAFTISIFERGRNANIA